MVESLLMKLAAPVAKMIGSLGLRKFKKGRQLDAAVREAATAAGNAAPAHADNFTSALFVEKDLKPFVRRSLKLVDQDFDAAAVIALYRKRFSSAATDTRSLRLDDAHLELAAHAFRDRVYRVLLNASEFAGLADRRITWETHRQASGQVLEKPSLSWEATALLSHRWLGDTFASLPQSVARLRQPLNIRDRQAPPPVARRRFMPPLHEALQLDRARILVSGEEGVGKTWLVADAVAAVTDGSTIVLMAGSAELDGGDLEALLSRLLCGRTGRGRPEGWTEVLRDWFPDDGRGDDGRRLILVLDGLNETDRPRWRDLLAQSMTPRWRSLTVGATVRPDLADVIRRRFETLGATPVTIPVDGFDDDELAEALSRINRPELAMRLSGDALETLLRTPRYFDLAARLWDRVADIQEVTVNRLILEDLRSRADLGTNALDDQVWSDLLQALGDRILGQAASLRLIEARQVLENSTLDPDAVTSGLEAIRSGRLFRREDDGYVLEETYAPLGIGMTLVFALMKTAPASPQAVVEELERLVPTLGAERRTDAVAAACAIAFFWRLEGDLRVLRAGLLRAWLGAQNRRADAAADAVGFVPIDAAAFVEAYESEALGARPNRQTLAVLSERIIAVHEHPDVRSLVLERAERWAGVIGLRESFLGADESSERTYRAQRLERMLGFSPEPGPVEILGAGVLFASGWDSRFLLKLVAEALGDQPLLPHVGVFRTAAVAMAIAGGHEGTTALRWRAWLNAADPDALEAALAQGARDLASPDADDLRMTRELAAVLLADFAGADSLDSLPPLHTRSELEGGKLYAAYLKDPVEGHFEVERRHMQAAFDDAGHSAERRLRRLADAFVEPDLRIPADISAMAAASVAAVEPSTLNQGRGRTTEDHHFEQLIVPLARTAPSVLGATIRRLANDALSREGVGLRMAAHQLREHIPALGPVASSGLADLLRERSAPGGPDDADINRLLFDLAVVNLSPEEQLALIQSEACDGIHLDMAGLLRLPGAAVIETALSTANERSLTNALAALLLVDFEMSPGIRTVVEQTASTGTDLQRSLAIQLLRSCADDRAARLLIDLDWRWSKDDDRQSHAGSWILIEGAKAEPLAAISERIAPWLLPRAVLERGSRPVEAAFVALVLETALFGDQAPEVVDDSVSVTVREDEDARHPPHVLISLADSAQSAESLRLALDVDARRDALDTAARRAGETIARALGSGATFYFRYIAAEDLSPFDGPMVAWAERLLADAAVLRRATVYAPKLVTSLAERLLIHSPELGARLLRASAEVGDVDRFQDLAEASSFVSGLFRAPPSASRDALIDELWSGRYARNDEAIFNVVYSAERAGAGDVLDRLIAEDRGSPRSWRRSRAVVANSFRQAAEADQDVLMGSYFWDLHSQGARITASKRAHANTLARHWFARFLDAPDGDEADAAWHLMLKVVDRRIRLWAPSMLENRTLDPARDAQLVLNNHELNRAIDRNERGLDKTYLGAKLK